MRFTVMKQITSNDELSKWEIVDYDNGKQIAEINGTKWCNEVYLSDEIAPLIAGDICDFLNDKYLDKNFNEEWPEINVKERLKYYKEQINKLENGKHYWNRHGTGVE